MTFPVLSASNPSGYTLNRSLRFRSSASAYLNRTFTTPTNEKIWTWSAWVKRGSLGIISSLFNASTGASPAYDGFRFNSSDQLQFFTGGAVTVNLVTNAVYRDPSSWYHIVLSYNATTTTVTIYVNGVAQTTTGTTVSNTTYSFNHASTLHSIGAQVINGAYTAGTYFDGYLTEVNFIDGQALTPSSFGAYNTTTGVWQPIKYSGTYGTNGYYLNFNNNASTTTLGYDTSGNSNNWTTNNISLTTGVTYDSMIDVPTPYADGGNGRGNYPVINFLNAYSNTFLSNGNLRYQNTNAYWANARATMQPAVGSKFYVEFTSTQPWTSNNVSFLGLCTPSMALTASAGDIATIYTTTTSGEVLALAIDRVNNQVSTYRNNALVGTTSISATNDIDIVVGSYAASGEINFGQRPFSYTPPTGFVALNTYNLPTPTIVNGASYMAATTYTGTGAAQNILNSNNTTTGVSFKPDFVWVKSRSSSSYSHRLFDVLRGTNVDLQSNTTNGDTSEANSLTAFNSNGYSVGVDSVGGGVNTNAVTYIGWQWQAGAGSSSSNTNGTITSTVSVNATAGFSIVTYTGTGANATVGHGLGVAPSFIITKVRSASGADWGVYHSAIGATQYLLLDTTAAAASSANFWNNTAPTSSVFSVGVGGSTNNSGNTMIAYCWSAVAGFSKFGSYTGNGSTDGPFVYCGFRPRFILLKRSSSSENWQIYDTSRDTYNVAGLQLLPNTNGAEADGRPILDILSNGFKLKNVSGGGNASGETYIYATFAESPFKVSLAR